MPYMMLFAKNIITYYLNIIYIYIHYVQLCHYILYTNAPLPNWHLACHLSGHSLRSFNTLISSRSGRISRHLFTDLTQWL